MADIRILESVEFFDRHDVAVRRRAGEACRYNRDNASVIISLRKGF